MTFGIIFTAVVLLALSQILTVNSRVDFSKKVEHLHNISVQSQKIGTPIFPRNGFLLGIARHRGFLPNEDVDTDMACFAHDIPKILNSDWGEYEFKYGIRDKLPERWDRDFFNGNHPVSGESLKYYELIVSHKHSSWKEDIPCFYKYKHGYYYYPMWTVKEFNSANEFKLNAEIYGGGNGGGVKILLGDKELPLTDLYKDENYKGKVGTVYRMSDFETFVRSPFYDTFMYIPVGYKNILRADYGSNVFDYMVNKNGTKVKLDSSNSAPKKI